jgi:dTDP-4-dehydrorhamnose 3,5-epimerase
MIIKELALQGVYEIIPTSFPDERGYFFEFYNEKTFASKGLNMNFVQDNHSFSYKNVLRGLHFQKEPFAQGKLVRVLKGAVMDIAVDLRKNSASFGQHLALVLDDKKNNMIYLPEGFAHGFITLEDSIVNYKCTNYYDKATESGIRWDDPELNIQWGVQAPIVSDKDRSLKFMSEMLKTGEF